MLTCSGAILISMSPHVRHATQAIIYLASASIGTILGRAVGQALFVHVPIPAGAFFIVVCIVAALLFGCLAPLEQRLIWRRWPRSGEANLKWIGHASSTLLTGTIESPVSLGFLLGMLSLLKG